MLWHKIFNIKFANYLYQEYIIHRESIERPYRSLLHERVFAQSHIPHTPVYSINEYNYQNTRGLQLSRAGNRQGLKLMDTKSAAFVVHLSGLLSSSFLVLEEITKFLEAERPANVATCSIT